MFRVSLTANEVSIQRDQIYLCIIRVYSKSRGHFFHFFLFFFKCEHNEIRSFSVYQKQKYERNYF